MTRRAAAAGLVAVALAGCGQSRVRADCVVRVFFASRMISGSEATRAEIAAVRRHLASSSRIGRFAFVPRRGRQPATFEVVPKSNGDARLLVAELRSLRGVDDVAASRC